MVLRRRAEVAGEEAGCAVGLEAGQRLVLPGVSVHGLLGRGEGVEQRERGVAVDVLVVPLEHELDRHGDLTRRLDQGSGQNWPKTAAVILRSAAVNGTPIAVPMLMPK